ncbi:hypothetical protein CHM34_00640 [Paludifilum halophilum]|uniref:Uncharacterized protein n=1 Tax=Paludifilum halophilum TaxID=1642702 RepID=A0A235BB71_9BACL|nr:hypothetical protein CHM34_00640 [Paludifilum halophilum]
MDRQKQKGMGKNNRSIWFVVLEILFLLFYGSEWVVRFLHLPIPPAVIIGVTWMGVQSQWLKGLAMGTAAQMVEGQRFQVGRTRHRHVGGGDDFDRIHSRAVNPDSTTCSFLDFN